MTKRTKRSSSHRRSVLGDKSNALRTVGKGMHMGRKNVPVDGWTCGFELGGAYIFACLIHVSFWRLGGFRVVLGDVLCGEEWPTRKVAGLNCFESYGFDWVAADGMHPLNSLFGGGEVVDTIGVLEN